jgi:acetyltransferase EpsM
MIYVYGAGGHAKVIVEILQVQNASEIVVVDENKEGELLDLSMSSKSILEKTNPGDKLIIAIGNNSVRRHISKENAHIAYTNAIHTSANISPRTLIGVGTVIMAGTSVNADTTIGEHCILNTNCSIDHDNVIGSFVHISPNAALAGNVEIGEGTHVGIGACVIQGIKIGKWTTIGAGAVIIKDVPDYAVVVGNPGRTIKYNSISD